MSKLRSLALALVALAALVSHGVAAGSTYSGKSTFEMRRDTLAKLAYRSDKEKGRHSTDFDMIRNSDIVGDWRYPTKSDVVGDWKMFQKEYPTPWHVEADFDNDGFLDHAWILISIDNTKMGLHVFMSSGADSYEAIILDEYSFSFSLPQRMGLDVLQPGRYETDCAQGMGPECKDGEPEFFVISNPSIYFFQFETDQYNSYYVWNKKESKFDQIWWSGASE